MSETNRSVPRQILSKARIKNAHAQIRANENPDDIEAAMAAHAAMLESRRAYHSMMQAEIAAIAKQIDDD